jgi:hypothetical protein
MPRSSFSRMVSVLKVEIGGTSLDLSRLTDQERPWGK